MARACSVCRAPHSPPAVVTNVVKLTEKVTLITGAGNNVVAQAGDGGSFLVDCGDAAHAPDVLKLAGRVATVMDTHWHLESTGANEAVAKAGAKFVAHGYTAVDYAMGARAADRATRWRAPRKDTADLLMSKGGVAGTPAQTKK